MFSDKKFLILDPPETIIHKQKLSILWKYLMVKKAAQEYMSKHTLAFSTPELTLMRFAFWLGDSVPDPKMMEKEFLE